tara:strand:- start:389 stop:1768 length:1380 start_codon:yes stop_codon:yes gene_type:complete
MAHSKINNKLIFSLFLLLNFLTIKPLFSSEEIKEFNIDPSNINLYSFSAVKNIVKTVDEDFYINFMKENIINQPEFKSSFAFSEEKRLLVLSAKRDFFPTINTRIINDEIIDRSIDETNSIRKRQDDSFDAVVELSQTIYSGGKLRGNLNFAKLEDQAFKLKKKEVLSELIISANHTYISAYISDYIYNYALDLINKLRPFKDKVKDRVSAGINDPIDFALFSVNFNKLESLLYNLEANSKRDQANYEYFFSTTNKPFGLPLFKIDKNDFVKKIKPFSTVLQEIEYEKSLEEVKITRSDRLPKLGFSVRYTEYDIDKSNVEDNDIRGGVFLNLPLVDFGRTRSKVNAAKAKSNAVLTDIDVDRKRTASIEKEIISKFDSALKARSQLLQAFLDTQNQREIIENRINISGFVANTLVTSAEKEIQQLQILLSSEYDLIMSFLELSHQNQALSNIFYMDLS